MPLPAAQLSFLRVVRFIALTLILQTLAAAQTPDPAPSIDRVGFPTDYTQTFVQLRQTTNTRKATQVTVYGNAPAASVMDLAALPYPNGSVLVMETMQLRKDAAGKPLVDDQGKYLPDVVLGLHVMRREAGFGADYGDQRSGEWEFVEYRPDGSYITPPPETATCAACHQKKAGPTRDYVFKARFPDTPK